MSPSTPHEEELAEESAVEQAEVSAADGGGGSEEADVAEGGGVEADGGADDDQVAGGEGDASGDAAVAGDPDGVESASSAAPTLRAARAPRDLDASLLRVTGVDVSVMDEAAQAPSTDPGFDIGHLSGVMRPGTEPGISGEGEPTEPDGPSPLGLLELGPALEAALADAEALSLVRRRAAEGEAGGDRTGPSSAADARILQATRERLHEVREEVLVLKRKLSTAEGRSATAERELETVRSDLKATRQRFVRSSERHEAELKRLERQVRDQPERLLRRHVETLFPALDALNAVARQVADDNDVPESLATGVSMLAAEFDRALGALEVTAFDALGQPFDPVVHAAVSERAATEGDRPGHVADQIGRGYLLRGRLMRPAQVVVIAGAELAVGEAEEATEVDHAPLDESAGEASAGAS